MLLPCWRRPSRLSFDYIEQVAGNTREEWFELYRASTDDQTLQGLS
jgi:hypothetical protein